MTVLPVLQRELLAARRDGDRAAAAALRTTLAALANAEAVPADGVVGADDDAHVAGSRRGAGAAEAERRTVTEAEQQAIVRAELDDLRSAAAAYDSLDPQRAAVARSGADTLARVLAETT